jgi:hypothetical protein
MRHSAGPWEKRTDLHVKYLVSGGGGVDDEHVGGGALLPLLDERVEVLLQEAPRRQLLELILNLENK